MTTSFTPIEFSGGPMSKPKVAHLLSQNDKLNELTGQWVGSGQIMNCRVQYIIINVVIKIRKGSVYNHVTNNVYIIST